MFRRVLNDTVNKLSMKKIAGYGQEMQFNRVANPHSVLEEREGYKDTFLESLSIPRTGDCKSDMLLIHSQVWKGLNVANY